MSKPKTESDYEKLFYEKRKDLVTLVFADCGIALCDNRFPVENSMVKKRVIKVISSKMWKDVYRFCEGTVLFKEVKNGLVK